MENHLLTALPLLAQQPDAPSILWTMWPLAAIALFFWLLLIRPQQRERRTRDDMLRALKPNDRVITVGGIYGVVTNVHREADSVTLKVDESTNTKLRVSLGAIARVLGDEPSKEIPSK